MVFSDVAFIDYTSYRMLLGSDTLTLNFDFM